MDVEPDQPFLAALRGGLPDCAGVALGIDRLLMLAQNADRLDEVLQRPKFNRFPPVDTVAVGFRGLR